MSVFIVTQWQASVGVGWMWGMGAFLVLIVDILMIAVIFKEHMIREWTVYVSKGLAFTEDGAKINEKNEEIE